MTTSRLNFFQTLPTLILLYSFCENESPTSFLATLQSYDNDSLWDNLTMSGDGEWLIHSILSNNLTVCSDGY
jgi:hypothetical protein